MPIFGYLKKVVTGNKIKGEVWMGSRNEGKQHFLCTKHEEQKDTGHSVDYAQPGREKHKFQYHIWI